LIFIYKNKFMALIVVNFTVFGLTRPGLELLFLLILSF
jgi:hypothetical protein